MASVNDIIGNYRLLEEIASGSFGRVYRAKHAYLPNRPIYALKLLLTTHLNSQKERDSFMQEARLLAMLEHPHILPIIDVGIHEKFPYMVTEYASNGSLRDRLQKQPHQPLPQDAAIIILSQIGQALQHAHDQNIIHRDLKPENILFNAKGEAVLADFGISTVLSSMSIQAATVVGTPPYMTPEQFEGMVSTKSDQYASGCIAYELFTGQQPFTIPNPSMQAWWYHHAHVNPTPLKQLNPNIPAYIEQAILKAMAKDRKDRHADVKNFITALYPPTIIPVAKTVEQWFEEGNKHYYANRYEEALLAYDQALRLDPSHAQAYNNKGTALHALQRYEEALVAYDHAIRLDSNYATPYIGKGRSLHELQLYEEAIIFYDQGIRLHPTAFAYRHKGVALYNLQRSEEALIAYDHALGLDPNYTFVYIDKEFVLNALGRYEEAIAACDQALRLDPNSGLAYSNRGAALNALKRYEEALVACDQALRLDPNYAQTHTRKGEALNKLQRYEEALVACDHAIRLNPNSSLAYIEKGIALTQLGQLEEARESLTKAQELLDKGYL